MNINDKLGLHVHSPLLKVAGMMARAYLITAVWADNVEGEPEPEKTEYATIKQAIADCKQFIELSSHLMLEHELFNIGHNFWLTRQGHGAGFWDGDYSQGDEITEIVNKHFKELHLFVQDSELYIE